MATPQTLTRLLGMLAGSKDRLVLQGKEDQEFLQEVLLQFPHFIEAISVQAATRASEAMKFRSACLVASWLICGRQKAIDDDRYLWNEQFMRALEMTDERERNERLTQISTDFIEIARVYGRTIISGPLFGLFALMIATELYLKQKDKTVGVQELKGVAGGVKFLVRGSTQTTSSLS